MAEDNKTTLVLVVVVGLLAIVAIIVSAVSLSKAGTPNIQVFQGGQAPGGGRPGNQGGGPSMQQNAAPAQQAPIYITPNGGNAMGGMAIDQGGAAYPIGSSGRIYTFAIGHDYGAHEYFDSKGYLAGFGIGIVDLVCEEAGLDCRLIWDRYENCWDSQLGQHATGGQGLHDRWYDACTGWYTTIERSHVFTQSVAYLKEPGSHLYVKKGRSIGTTKDELQNKKILFIEGWASDGVCFNRVIGVPIDDSNGLYVSDDDAAVAKLNEGWDAIFTTRSTMDEKVATGDYTQVGEWSCMLEGNGIMSRKDNDITTHWNRGFNKIKGNGKFKKYCKEANDAHSAKGHVTCVDSY